MTQPAGERESEQLLLSPSLSALLTQEVDSVGNWQDFLRSASVTFAKKRLGCARRISSGTAVGTCPAELAPGTNQAWHRGGKVREMSGPWQQNREIILCVCIRRVSRVSFKSC